MNKNRDSGGLLLLIDALILLLTTIVFTVVFSKITGSFDTNVLIVTLFYYGVKILVMGIADITGIGKNIVVGIVFVLISDFILLAVNLLMAFGMSYTVMLISAAADILGIVLIRIFWNKKTRKSFKASDDGFRDNNIPQGIDLKDGRYEGNRNQLPAENTVVAESGKTNGSKGTHLENFYATGTIPRIDEELYKPVVEVDMEPLETANPVGSQKIIAEATNDQSQDAEEKKKLFEDTAMPTEDRYQTRTAADNFFDFEFPQKERPMDAPNLGAMDAFFEAPAAKKEEVPEAEETIIPLSHLVQGTVIDEPDNKLSEANDSKAENVTAETPERSETASMPETPAEDHVSRSAEVEQLTHEMNRQFEVLQNRVDDLEEREKALRQREEQLEKSRKVDVRPKEVVLDNEESEIIIDEADLELLKAYLRQHPEI